MRDYDLDDKQEILTESNASLFVSQKQDGVSQAIFCGLIFIEKTLLKQYLAQSRYSVDIQSKEEN